MFGFILNCVLNRELSEFLVDLQLDELVAAQYATNPVLSISTFSLCPFSLS